MENNLRKCIEIDNNGNRVGGHTFLFHRWTIEIVAKTETPYALVEYHEKCGKELKGQMNKKHYHNIQFID